MITRLLRALSRPTLPLLRRCALGALFAITASLHGAPADDLIQPDELRQGYRRNTLIARPRTAAADSALARAETDASLRLRRSYPRLRALRVIELDRAEDPREAAKRLAATGLYDYVEVDRLYRARIVPDDPQFPDQWHLRNTGLEEGKPGADISAPAAWDITREAPDVIVAVMDSGIRLTHRDIIGNLWTNPGESGGGKESNGIDDDADGYVDDFVGVNATVARTSTSAKNTFDDNGHGTHVAGIIGATGNNALGVTGVAWRVKLMPLKFLNSQGVGSTAAALDCINYAILKKARIINGSWGGIAASKALLDVFTALRDAGIIYVASAGNSTKNDESFAEYPAAFVSDNIVTVANTNRRDELDSSSSFGAGVVELAAPGTDIWSLGVGSDTDYRKLTGTSMSAPMVSGALALLAAKFPDDTPRALINRLLNSVDVLPSLAGKVATGGRLNLARALTATNIRPLNDDFARRVELNPGEISRARSSTLAATRETGEPVHAAADATGSVWWTWTPKDSGHVILDTTDSLADTTLAVYVGSALANLRNVVANDDAEAGQTYSRVEFDAIAGTTYHFAVATRGATGAFVGLHLSAVPAHNAFAAAKALNGVGFVEEGTTLRANSEPGENLFAGKAKGRSLWYRWTAPATRNYQLSVASPDGTGDPITGVYTGGALTSLREIVTDDDSGYGLDAYATFNATAGMTYLIAVDDRSGSVGAAFRLTLADADWQFVSSFAATFTSSPAAAPDGTIYIPDDDGYLYAINPDGTQKWRYTLTGYLYHCTPAIGADGTVYIGDDEGYFYAVDPEKGTRKWRATTGDSIYGSPAIAADGTLYVKSMDGYLYAYAADGVQKWRSAAGNSLYNSPVVAPDGTIYITSTDAEVIAFAPDGARKWSFPTGVSIYATPTLGSDGTVYVANYLGRFYAIRPDGTQRWIFDVPEAVSGSAVIAADNTLYFAARDRNLYAVNAATGAKLWSYLCADEIIGATPALAADGTVFIGDVSGVVHAVGPDGKLRRTYATAGEVRSSPAIIGGRLVFGSGDTHVYAFDLGQNAATGPWPMWRQNLRRVGRSSALAGLPTLSTPPVSLAANPGSSVSLTAPAAASDSTALTYQWRLNGRAIAGATSSTYNVVNAQAADAGSYSVVVKGSGGSLVTATTTLALNSVPTTDARLVNLAVRTTAGPDAAALIVGFVIGGAGTIGDKPLLLRASGPALAAFGVPATLADPLLNLYSGSTIISTNDNWSATNAAAISTAAATLGAFPFAAASLDAALLATPAAGGYTVQVTPSASGAPNPGATLAEIYDATAPGSATTMTPRLINVSTRTSVGAGDVLIVGFAIQGTTARTVLIRAIGPTLSVFGVPGALADAKLELYAGSTRIQTNDNWGEAANSDEVAGAFGRVGAFPLARDTKDAAMLVTLPPGGYTAQVTGVGATTGVALVEVYELP